MNVLRSALLMIDQADRSSLALAVAVGESFAPNLEPASNLRMLIEILIHCAGSHSCSFADTLPEELVTPDVLERAQELVNDPHS